MLGCCFFFGGIRYPVQKFNAVANQAMSSLLFLSAIGITLPTAAKLLSNGGDPPGSGWILDISRGTAIVR